MRIVPGFTAFNPYDLYSMPYSHSLLGALGWSVLSALCGFVWLRRMPGRERAVSAVVLGALVASHFLLDLPMHTADLPLGFAPDSAKLGLGLWNLRGAAIAAELAVLVTGGLIYLRATRARSPAAGTATGIFGVALVALAVATPFMPDPSSASAFAIQALASYLLLAGAAAWLDGVRPARQP
jgi:hypothetical protein